MNFRDLWRTEDCPRTSWLVGGLSALEMLQAQQPWEATQNHSRPSMLSGCFGMHLYAAGGNLWQYGALGVSHKDRHVQSGGRTLENRIDRSSWVYLNIDC